MEKPKYVPGDIIGGMFFYFYSESPNLPFFVGDLKKIHEAIFELRKSYPILKSFPFSEKEVSHFSRLLESVLHRLQLSRIIGMENPDFKRFIVKKPAVKYLEESIIPLFNEEEKQQLKKIGKEFLSRCGDL
ncbi:hypothetical protein ACFL23_03820 [Patescibacteria group bacterium]